MNHRNKAGIMISSKFSRFNICIVRFPGPVPCFEAYREVAETVKYGLQALGYNAILSDDKLMRDCVNIVFGYQILAPDMVHMLSEPAIFYNLEKMFYENPDLSASYQPINYEIKSRVPVWDYDLENCDRHRQIGITNVVHVPIGYMPEMNRIEPAKEQDIDVLFYGGVTERRNKVLQGLREAGLKVTVLQNVWGIERDRYIARSKVVLNMHSSRARIFEVVRVSYLLANSKAVVSEYCEGTLIEDDFLKAVVLADYEELVPACVDIVSNLKKRRFYEENGFAVMSARDETVYLKTALSRTFNLTDN